MKNNMNKKVMIAIFFSMIMFAGAFAVMASGSSNTELPVINNVPATASTAASNLNNISYQSFGCESSKIQKENFTNDGNYKGYFSFNPYIHSGDVTFSIYFTNFTFEDSQNSIVNFGTYSNINATICIEFLKIVRDGNMTSNPENYNIDAASYYDLMNSLHGDGMSNIYLFYKNTTILLHLGPTMFYPASPYSYHNLYSDEVIVHKNILGAEGNAYNPYYNEIYSFAGNTFSINILNGTNYNYIRNITSSPHDMPFSGTYDPYNHNEYVYGVNFCNPISDDVLSFNGSNYTTLSNTSYGIVASAYDPVNHDLYGVSSNMLGFQSPENGVYVMNATSIIDHIDYSSGINDFSVIYDTFNGMIYAPDDISSSSYGIAEIDPVNNTYIGLISTPKPVNLMAINPVNHEIYASTYMKNTSAPIYVYNASTMSYIGTMGVLSSMMGIQVVDGYLYVEGNDSTLDVFSSNNSLAYSYLDVNCYEALMGLSYDNATNKVIVTSMGYSRPPSNTPSPTLMAAFTPGVPVGNLSLKIEEYDNETAPITVKLYNNAYSFSEPGNGNVIFSSLQSGNYNYIATYNSHSENGTINLTHSEAITLAALGSKYSVIITESGLTSGISWSFTFNSHTYTLSNTSYTFYEINGTYLLHASPANYEYPVYNPFIVVSGVNITETIQYSLYDFHIFNNTAVIGYWLNNTESRGYFSYAGYNYSETIFNQTSIFIATTNIHAPNVTLSFKVSTGVYDVLMTNANNTTSIINQTSPVNGYINVTYNPAKMPLNPTFSVSPVPCVVAPAPPPLPPGGPVSVITHPVKYFDYSIWTILMWAAIAAAVVAALYIVFRRH